MAGTPTTTADLLNASLTLAARATSATTSAASGGACSSGGKPPVYKVVGICLAVASGFFIGVSFVLKKVGLLKANVKYHEEAGEGYGYLKNAYWWTGMTLMIIGEICNFVAYAFTDAILVTPLGALSVVITTILSTIFLKERLSFVGKIGCFICIVGSVIIPLNAPEQSAVCDIQQMQHYVIAPGFLSYTGVILVGVLVVVFYLGPKYGKKSMLVYLSVCSLIGGLSVTATQGLGSAVLAQINGESQFNHWFLYVLFVFVVVTLLTEIVYLNKALNLFNAALVTPTYYVYFTSSTIVASAVLFRGFHGTTTQIVDVVLGFLVICSGVVLLQLAKSSKDVPDTAVLKGDLDQVRTVAEQAEPEYEPRADTIRGGAGIIRAMSKVRTQRQAEEAKRIHEERMQPIGEGEEFEWDGLRRRKTVSSGPSVSGSVKRSKTVHPPLGMSQFPDDLSEAESEVHPGFFGRIGKKSHTTAYGSLRGQQSSVPLRNVASQNTMETANVDNDDTHTLGLPTGLQKPDGIDGQNDDTSYHGAGGSQHVHFAGLRAAEARDRAPSQSSSNLAPPRPPPHAHGAKRQFSFQNVFHRKRSDSADIGDRPVSRGGQSYSSMHSDRTYPGDNSAGHTEEERLGLVHGDSNNPMPQYSRVVEEPEDLERERSNSDEWQVTSGTSSSPEQISSRDLNRERPRDPYDTDNDDFFEEPIRSPTRDMRDEDSRGAFV